MVNSAIDVRMNFRKTPTERNRLANTENNIGVSIKQKSQAIHIESVWHDYPVFVRLENACEGCRFYQIRSTERHTTIRNVQIDLFIASPCQTTPPNPSHATNIDRKNPRLKSSH